MASRVSRIYGGTPLVTVFELDKQIFDCSNLNIRIFQQPTKEWALFVINNRNRHFSDFSNIECNLDLKYDLVIGPIADDDLALLFQQFSNGMIGVDTLVREMEFKRLTDQYSFHTERSLKYLKKVGLLHDETNATNGIHHSGCNFFSGGRTKS
jgi:hypothetical protein